MTTAIKKMEEYLRKDGKMEITDEARATILEENKARFRENYPLPHIPTGITELDNLIGGPGAYRSDPLLIPCPGLPKGRICQFVGEPELTQSVALQIAKQTLLEGHSVIYVDQRGDADLEKAKSLGCVVRTRNIGNYISDESATIGKLINWTIDHSLTIVAVSPTNEFFNSKESVLTRMLPQLRILLSNSKHSVIFLLEKDTVPLTFFSSLRITLERLENGRVRASAIKNMMAGTAGLDVEFDL